MVRDLLALFLVVDWCEEGQDYINEEGTIDKVAPDFPAKSVLAFESKPVRHDKCDIQNQTDYVQVPPLFVRVVVHNDKTRCWFLYFDWAVTLAFWRTAAFTFPFIEILGNFFDKFGLVSFLSISRIGSFLRICIGNLISSHFLSIFFWWGQIFVNCCEQVSRTSLYALRSSYVTIF